MADLETARAAAQKLSIILHMHGLIGASNVAIDNLMVDAGFLGPEAVDVLQTLGVTAIGIDEEDIEIKAHLTKRATRAQKDILPAAMDAVPIIYSYETLVSINPLRLKRRELTQGPLANDVVRCGDSISAGNHRSAGTLGALVRGRNDNKLYGLTCNHVTGGCNLTPEKMPIVSPGILDVQDSTQKIQMIGRHSRVIPLQQGPASIFSGQHNYDAAIFEIENPDLVSSSQRGFYDTPAEVTEPEIPMIVSKVGRTTEFRKGRIRERMLGTQPLDYAYKVPLKPDAVKSFQGVCAFDNAWKVGPLGGQAFATAGDSGSLVVVGDGGQQQPKKAVGLLFSAGKTTGNAYILPLRPILDYFQVDLVSGHNL